MNNREPLQIESVLSHYCREATELKNIPGNEEQSVEYFFFLASCATFGKRKNKQRQGAENGQYEVHNIEWGFPELLIKSQLVEPPD